MSDYKVKATDSAGTQFQLGAADEAIKALALVNAIEAKRLPVRDVVIEAPDGTAIDREELKRRAMEEVHASALERAGRTHVPGRPPGE
jgi:hypothetical protein